MQKIIGKLIMLVAIFCAISCGSSKSEESDFAGTYEVLEKEGYIYPSFNIVLNEDESVRVNINGKGETYGSWMYASYDEAVHIWMDNDFEFVFGFKSPVLDPKTNRLYVSKTAFEQKHPEKYFNVRKK